MQPTSSIEPVLVLEHPGRHRRSRHQPRLCAVCSRPLASQEGICWHCGAPVAEPPHPWDRPAAPGAIGSAQAAGLERPAAAALIGQRS